MVRVSRVMNLKGECVFERDRRQMNALTINFFPIGFVNCCTVIEILQVIIAEVIVFRSYIFWLFSNLFSLAGVTTINSVGPSRKLLRGTSGYQETESVN